jgi:hypothetical protein
LKLSRPVSSNNKSIGKKEDTLVFYGVETVINIILEFLNHTNSKIDACVDYSRPSGNLSAEIFLLSPRQEFYFGQNGLMNLYLQLYFRRSQAS